MKEKTHLGNRLLSVLLTFLMLLSLLPSAALAADTQQIALMAVTQNGFLIEPEYVTYHSGDTVKDVLKKSSHTFSGIDSGYITAVDGTTDNFSIHYDEDGYKLDQSANGLTAIWFTTNSSQSHGANLQQLAANMAVYNTATNGLRDYKAAQEAYDAAVKGFYAATDTTAKTLNDALFSAIDKHAKFLEGKTTPLTISATMGGEAITPGEAVFTSEFGTVVTVKNTNTVDLIPATYTFDLSDGEFRHVRGTLEVKEGTTLTAQLPAGQWIKSVGIGIDNYWKTYGEMPKQDVTAAEGTYLIPDHSYRSLYPYFEPGDGVDTTNIRVYKAGDPNGNKARSWKSKADVLTDSVESNSLKNADVVCEARLKGGTYEQYQTYTIHVIRTPSLSDLAAADSVSGLTLSPAYANTTDTYTVATSQDQVKITPTALCSGTAITVAGKSTQSGSPVTVNLADCEQDSGKKYLIPVVLTANGQSVTYTVKVQKQATVSVTLNHEEGLDVKVYSQTGDYIAPTSSTGTADIYTLTLGLGYTYLATKDVYYHAEGAFQAVPNRSYDVPTPVTDDWLTGLSARTGNNAPLCDMSPTFTEGTHEYTFTVESNSSIFQLQRVRADSSYKTTFYAAYHRNTAWPDRTIEKALTTSDTSYTTTALNNFMAVGGYGNTARLKVAQSKTVNGATLYQDYFIHVNRTMTLDSLSAKDQNDVVVPLNQGGDTTKATFTKLVYDYTADVSEKASELRLTLRPLSSYRMDADMTVTVACGGWSQSITYDKDHSPAVRQTVAVPLKAGSAAAETITVTVSHKETGSIAGTYTIKVNKQAPIETTITTTPGDATVFLTSDVTGDRILPGDKGTYTLDSGSSYTVVATRYGYVGQKKTFTAGEANKTVQIKLEKAPDSTLKDIELPTDWPLFRKNDENNGVVDVRTPITAEDTEAYYFTSKGGDLYQVKVNADGTFTKGSLRRLHLDNGADSASAPPMSTSTPVIANGRAYIGVSGTSQFTAYSGHNITVVDLSTFSIAYSVPTMGYPQTSGLLTTAYQNGDGYNYVYFFDNFTPGKLRVIRDMPGMTEVDHDYTTMETYSKDGEEHTIETAYVLFTPDGAQAQYAICSPVVDEEGNIYFKNDSAQLMRLSSRITELEVTQQPDRTTYSKDDTFDATGLKVTAHYANGATKDVSDYLKYTTDPLTTDDTEITIGINLEQLVKDKLENLPENLKNQTAKWQQYQDKDGKAGVEWEIPTTTVTITVEEHHNYGEPTWNWNNDFTASAVFTCTDDDGHTQTVPATVTDEVTTEATCESTGVRTYTAKVTFEGKEYTDTKTEVIPATDHDTELVGAKDATCTEDGYTGNEVCKVCQTVVKQGEVIPALGHDYKDGK